ncbi:proline dehydrogenase 1, mitochondrial [Periophthalmus magnuspinnatus]|uniref:proline dehydrogenase 1, mitochondrial n=1 Tax=Periophthalmus magnuspinnatus TaxID=409849 RepID=UPI002436FDCD|nr:proline dehydrogenase 1, mitochondrial [Periophthalmus magnuspinnatus]
MLHVRTVPSVTRTGVKRLLCPRRPRSSSSVVSDAGTERADRGAEPDCPGQWGQDKHGPGSAPDPDNEIHIDFEQTQEAYRSKDSIQLLRSLVVFKLCSYDVMVHKNKEITALGKRLLGQRAFNQVMKMTFYGQFVAGEDHVAIKPLIQKNQAYGVGSVLDYSVEEDIGPEETELKDSCTAAADTSRLGHDRRGKQHQEHANFHGGASGTATYFHADESKCDRHMSTFMKCIKASGATSSDGFSAIKMTALGRPQFLLEFSEVLVKWQRFFNFLALKQGKVGGAALERRVDLTQLQEQLTGLGASGDYHGWFTENNKGSCGTIDVLDWSCLLDDRERSAELLVVPNVQLGKLEPLLKDFTDEDEQQLQRILQRVDELAKCAVENGVRLMVDAEQTYFQPAISRLTLQMQKIYNKETPVIFNTYQCYLKDAFTNVSTDVHLSRREGWRFAAKLVRGAYMYQERERAKERGYDDPINPDYESTNEMYHRCLDFVLDEIAQNGNATVMVASHNEDTVKHTLRRMNELGLTPRENRVYFGQLLGMCDQISFPLGQAGFPVYKYVPYGPVDEVMPYLTRRAQENRGFMQGAQKERELLWKELKRRVCSGELLHRPAF